MFWDLKLTSYLLLVFLAFSKVGNAKEFQTILIGGGLNVCSSVQPENCLTPLSTNETHHTQHSYILSAENIKTLTALYKADAALHNLEMDIFISNLNKYPLQKTMSYPEKELARVFRNTGVGESTDLKDIQWQMILDVLQDTVINRRFLQKDQYKNAKVDVFNSKNVFVAKAFRQFIDSVDGDNILIVTAANRDAFEDVYWLIKTFEQFDVDAKWLPLDAALNAVWKESGLNDDETLKQACSNLNSVRHKVSKRYFRDRIYGDLSEQLLDVCNSPEDVVELIDDANGIYFHDGDPEVLLNSFMFSDIEANPAWLTIMKRHQQNKLTLAFNGGSIRAISGKEGRNAFVVKGRSEDVLMSGYQILSDVSNIGSVHIQNSPILSLAGLDLFSGISFDNSFGDLSNQGRLLSLLAMIRVPYGIGIDERTVLSIAKKKDTLTFSVSGEAGVTFLDNTAGKAIALSPAKFDHLQMNYLTQDDVAELKENKLIFDFANWKYSSNRFSQPVVQSGSVFRPEGFSKTMYMLCTTGAKKAVLKHIELGKGHIMTVEKLPHSASVSGSRNVNGENYGYCSYRGYNISIEPN